MGKYLSCATADLTSPALSNRGKEQAWQQQLLLYLYNIAP